MSKLTLSRQPGHGQNLDLFSRADIEQTLTARFRHQVRLNPDKLALVSATHRWSYRDLAAVVDRLAALILQQCGPAPGRLALLFNHDVPMCAAMLAALQAGKTYVPLDPTYPAARLSLIWEDSQPDALLADLGNEALAREMRPDGRQLIVIDSDTPDWRKPLAPGEIPTWPQVSPHHPAYILYTSGSTGRPKGVVQNHRNVLHFICEYTRNLAIVAEDRMTLLSSYSFDAAVMAIYGALLNGAALFPLPLKTSGFAAIGPWLDHHQITFFHSTPTVLRAFLSSQPPSKQFASVSRVVMGGEPVTRSDVTLFERHFLPGATLVNGLGPTESTVTLENFIAHGSMPDSSLVPVGLPVGHTEVLLLNEQGQPVPDEGELAFCSDHLALGYWHRPDQDALAFHPHPLDPSRRIYRTGDLARRNAQGLYVFIGRKDLQVKINGVRIELEEIECAVEALPGVRQCIALAQADAKGATRIVAYLKMQAPGCFNSHGLIDLLRRQLPEALIPKHMVEVPEFPLTPSNKVDRQALGRLYPHADAVVTATASGWKPQADDEIRLAALWEQLLGAPPASLTADFFDSGGDSLATLNLVDGIEQWTGRRLGMGLVFQNRQFGALLTQLRTDPTQLPPANDNGSLVPLTRPPQATIHLYCICGIQLYQQLANALGPQFEVSGVFLPVEEEISRGGAVPDLETIASMYRSVIQAHQPAGPYHLAGVSFGGMLVFEIARQLLAQGEKVAFAGIFDTALPHLVTRRQRLLTHLRLLMRHGWTYAHERLAKRRLNTQSSPPPMTEISRDAMALRRGDIYTEALNRYRSNMPVLEGNLCFYRAQQCSEFEQLVYPLDCGWSRYVGHRCVAHSVPGGHVTMLDAPYVDQLAHTMRRDISDLS